MSSTQLHLRRPFYLHAVPDISLLFLIILLPTTSFSAIDLHSLHMLSVSRND